MSFMGELINNTDGKISRLAKESSTFNVAYEFWRNFLMERAMRLFIWENTDDILPKNIESTLLLNGVAGVTKKYKNKLTVFYGKMNGITEYYTDYSHFDVYSPLYSAHLKIDKDIVVIDNNALRNSIYHLIHRYAIMLGHTEITLINVLVNMRDGGNIPVVNNQNEKAEVERYRSNLYNGKVGAIQSPAFLGVEWKGSDVMSKSHISELIETRERLLQSFYKDLGVKTSNEKKGNMIVEEVNANDSMLLLNLNDMLDARKRGAEKVNEKYGTNWTVRLAEELNYLEGDTKGVENNATNNNFGNVEETESKFE